MPTPLDYASISTTRPSTSWIALAAVVVGTLSLGLAFLASDIVRIIGYRHVEAYIAVVLLLGVVAAILGSAEVGRMRKRTLRGGYLAFVGIAFGLFAVYTLLTTGTSFGRGVPSQYCPSNMRQLGLGIIMYSNDHRGWLPPSLGALVLSEIDLTPSMFVCPLSGDVAANAASVQGRAAQIDGVGFCSYVYVGAGLTSDVSPDTILAYERAIHHGDGINVLFADARVESWSAEKADKMLAELEAGHNPPRAEMLK